LRIQDVAYVIGLAQRRIVYEELSQTRGARYRDNMIRVLEIITVTRNFTKIPNITTVRKWHLRNDAMPGLIHLDGID